MRPKGNGQKGFVLIITLLVTALLVAVLTEIVFAVHVQTSTAASYRDAQRAALLAAGGVELAAAVLKQSGSGLNYTTFEGISTTQVLSDDDGFVTIRVEDEHGKVDLNSVVYNNGKSNPTYYAIFTRLAEGLDLDGALADTLSDWIDMDDDPRPWGAETYDYYQSLTPGYRAKGAPLDTLEEALLIKGFDPDVFRKLSGFTTVYTSGKVNINTASKEVIMALSDAITPDMAAALLEYRKESPFESKWSIKKVPGFDTIDYNTDIDINSITVKSEIFRVFTRAVVGEGIREVEAVVQTSVPRRILYWRER